jgi:Flp pilus assembly protein protease CpaA
MTFARALKLTTALFSIALLAALFISSDWSSRLADLALVAAIASGILFIAWLVSRRRDVN